MSGPERNCDDCGEPLSICNAKAMIRDALERHPDANLFPDALAAAQAEIDRQAQSLKAASAVELIQAEKIVDLVNRLDDAEADTARLREQLELRGWIADCPVAPNADAPKAIWANPSPNDHTNPVTADWTEGDWIATANSLAEKYVRADHAARLQAQVEALKGALQRMHHHAKGLSFGTDWNKGNHAILHGHRQGLIDSIPEATAILAAHDSNPAGVDRTQEDGTDE